MKHRYGRIIAAGLGLLCCLLPAQTFASDHPANDYPANHYLAARTSDKRPDLNGIWQALGSAQWNLEGHAAAAGPDLHMGALGATPAGLGVVVGGRIPYLPGARAQRDANQADRLKLDPAVKCYLPGVPRATYLGLPFQILQTPDNIFIAYEFAAASRTIAMNQPDLKAPINTWMGHSIGHWEGDTLVVSVTDQVADTWLDRAGNFHSDKLVVEERYTPLSPHHLMYEATLTDSDVYRTAWKIRLPLYRRMEPGAQLLDFRCVEFVEDLMYGDLTQEKAP